jgi:protein phosphatase
MSVETGGAPPDVAVNSKPAFSVYKDVNEASMYAAAIVSAPLDFQRRKVPFSMDTVAADNLNNTIPIWQSEFARKRDEAIAARKQKEDEEAAAKAQTEDLPADQEEPEESAVDAPEEPPAQTQEDIDDDAFADELNNASKPPEGGDIQFAQARNNPNDGPFENRRGDQWDSASMTESTDSEQNPVSNINRLLALLPESIRRRLPGYTPLMPEAIPEPEYVESTEILPTQVAAVSERGEVRKNNEDSIFTLETGFSFSDIAGDTETDPQVKQRKLAETIAIMMVQGTQEAAQLEQNTDRVNARIDHVVGILKDQLAAGKIQGLEIVADGMGGHGNGEMASALATFGIVSSLAQNAERGQPITEDTLRDAIISTNRIIKMYNEKKGTDSGTTLAVTLRTPDGIMLSNVGDARIYKMNENGRVVLLTNDDTRDYIWSLYENNIGSPDQLPSKLIQKNSPLTKALDGKSTMNDIQVYKIGQLRQGEKLILADDGIYNDFVTDPEETPYAIESMLKDIDDKYLARIAELQRGETGIRAIDAHNLAFREALGKIFSRFNLNGVSKNASAADVRTALFQNNGKYSHDNGSAIVISP